MTSLCFLFGATCIDKESEFGFWFHRFENVYMDGEIRVAKDIRGDYLIVDRAPYNWTESFV